MRVKWSRNLDGITTSNTSPSPSPTNPSSATTTSDTNLVVVPKETLVSNFDSNLDLEPLSFGDTITMSPPSMSHKSSSDRRTEGTSKGPSFLEQTKDLFETLLNPTPVATGNTLSPTTSSIPASSSSQHLSSNPSSHSQSQSQNPNPNLSQNQHPPSHVTHKVSVSSPAMARSKGMKWRKKKASSFSGHPIQAPSPVASTTPSSSSFRKLSSFFSLFHSSTRDPSIPSYAPPSRSSSLSNTRNRGLRRSESPDPKPLKMFTTDSKRRRRASALMYKSSALRRSWQILHEPKMSYVTIPTSTLSRLTPTPSVVTGNPSYGSSLGPRSPTPTPSLKSNQITTVNGSDSSSLSSFNRKGTDQVSTYTSPDSSATITRSISSSSPPFRSLPIMDSTPPSSWEDEQSPRTFVSHQVGSRAPLVYGSDGINSHLLTPLSSLDSETGSSNSDSGPTSILRPSVKSASSRSRRMDSLMEEVEEVDHMETITRTRTMKSSRMKGGTFQPEKKLHGLEEEEEEEEEDKGVENDDDGELVCLNRKKQQQQARASSTLFVTPSSHSHHKNNLQNSRAHDRRDGGTRLQMKGSRGETLSPGSQGDSSSSVQITCIRRDSGESSGSSSLIQSSQPNPLHPTFGDQSDSGKESISSTSSSSSFTLSPSPSPPLNRNQTQVPATDPDQNLDLSLSSTNTVTSLAQAVTTSCQTGKPPLLRSHIMDHRSTVTTCSSFPMKIPGKVRKIRPSPRIRKTASFMDSNPSSPTPSLQLNLQDPVPDPNSSGIVKVTVTQNVIDPDRFSSSSPILRFEDDEPVTKSLAQLTVDCKERIPQNVGSTGGWSSGVSSSSPPSSLSSPSTTFLMQGILKDRRRLNVDHRKGINQRMVQGPKRVHFAEHPVRVDLSPVPNPVQPHPLRLVKARINHPPSVPSPHDVSLPPTRFMAGTLSNDPRATFLHQHQQEEKHVGSGEEEVVNATSTTETERSDGNDGGAHVPTDWPVGGHHHQSWQEGDWRPTSGAVSLDSPVEGSSSVNRTSLPHPHHQNQNLNSTPHILQHHHHSLQHQSLHQQRITYASTGPIPRADDINTNNTDHNSTRFRNPNRVTRTAV